MDVEGLLTQGETPKQILTEALADYKGHRPDRM